MHLAAWYVSGITYRSEEFLQGQQAMCSSHGVQGQKSSTQRLGNVFVAGVIGNREILFKQIDLVTVCDFLIEQFEDSKKSYGTINSYRSALSSMLLPVDGYSVGEHPIT